MDIEREQRFEFVSPKGERVFTIPGRKSQYDMIIMTEFPKMPWAHSFYYIGMCLRLKAVVENRNYPNGKGDRLVAEYCQLACLEHDLSIAEIGRITKIPENC